MKSAFWFYIFLTCILPMSLNAQEYESMRIARIDVTVNNTASEGFSPGAIRAKLNTKVGNYFSQYEFDADLKMLSEDYEHIEPKIEIIHQEIFLSIHLFEKPRINTIEFIGNERISTRKLEKTLEIDPGTIFDRSEFIQAFNKLKLLYVKKGYFEADLDYEIVKKEDSQVDILVHISEGRPGKIKRITFEGLTSAEETDILEEIVSRKYNLLLSWYTGRGTYHPEMIEHDRLQIINYLQNLGYADALVELCIEEIEGSERIDLIIRVAKGVRYQFGQVCFIGNTLFSDAKIWEAIQFRAGYAYSPEKLRNSVKAISDSYGTSGYIDANIDAQLSLREDCPVYDVVITINEGIQYYVGLIKVFGNRCTQTNVILHETLLCPGEVFDNRKLEATERRLRNTGFFCNVNVYPVRSLLDDPLNECNYRDVYIEVEETDTGNLGLFFGFSSVDRIFGGLEITERNFNIAGITRLFENGFGALRGGGEFAHAKMNIGDRQTSYLLQWTKPYFLDTPWILGVDLEKTNNRALSRAYEVKTYGGSVHGIYILNPFMKYDLYYRARHTNVVVRDSANAQLDREAQGGFISAAGNALIYDSTDHPRRPCHGLRSRLLFELAGLGGNYQFMKFSYLNSYYYPLSKKGTLKFRADMQFIKTYGSTDPEDLPISERFFLGGEGTVRGYRPYIIGPKFGPNEPSGGLSSYLVSEEYQHNLLTNPMLDGFVFIDAGYVSFSEFSVGRPAAAVGFGIRIEVMRNMPLMFGVGWPIHPSETLNGQKINNAQRFFFSMGGCF